MCRCDGLRAAAAVRARLVPRRPQRRRSGDPAPVLTLARSTVSGKCVFMTLFSRLLCRTSANPAPARPARRLRATRTARGRADAPTLTARQLLAVPSVKMQPSELALAQKRGHRVPRAKRARGADSDGEGDDDIGVSDEALQRKLRTITDEREIKRIKRCAVARAPSPHRALPC